MDSEFQSDYLLVHENGKKILHLGLVKSESGKDRYHCNYGTRRRKNAVSGMKFTAEAAVLGAGFVWFEKA